MGVRGGVRRRAVRAGAIVSGLADDAVADTGSGRRTSILSGGSAITSDCSKP
jgi:hypothetical protein